jgi:hypothetical protein
MGAVPTPVLGARTLPNVAMTLAATRISPDVGARLPSLAGRVRSVHRAAIYVDAGSPRTLVVVAIDDVGGVPGGVLVAGIADLRETGIRPGMAVVPSSRGVSIPTAAIEIDVTNAISWSPSLPPGARLRPTPELDRTVAVARRLAAAHACPGGLAPAIPGTGRAVDPWQARAAHLIDRHLTALATGDVVAAEDVTVELIGLGVGLTPSGDDYLVGLLAGLEATDDPVRHRLATAIAAQADLRTTVIGAEMLRHAAAGAFAERLHDMLIALARGSLDLATAVERVMAYGATSGGDTLVGLFGSLDLARARARDVPVVAA